MRNPAFVCGAGMLVLALSACSGTNRSVTLLPQSMDPIPDRGFGEEVEVETGLPSEEEAIAAAAAAVAEVEVAAPLEGLEVEQLPRGSTAAGSDGRSAGAARARQARSAVEQGEPDETLVVIEESDDAGELEGRELLRASLAERNRRRTAPPAVVVITNENLAELAEGGKVTYVDRAASQIDLAPGVDPLQVEEEAYWRSRVRSIRADWRDSHDQIEELEAKAAELRRRFYGEDDPYVRDGRIKPEWDRTIDLLQEARRRVDEAQAELEVALEDGRRAGALPGWLRDGLELEPEPEPEEEMPEADPEEPKVIDP